MNEEELNEIIIACIQDERLREILGRVLSMNEREKNDFRKKINLFFLDKTSHEDLQSKRFFNLITSDNNALLINNRIKEHHGSEDL